MQYAFAVPSFLEWFPLWPSRTGRVPGLVPSEDWLALLEDNSRWNDLNIESFPEWVLRIADVDRSPGDALTTQRSFEGWIEASAGTTPRRE